MASIGTDPERFETFYRTHLGTVQRFLARRTTNVHAVADLTADVLVTAIESLTTFDPKRGTEQGRVGCSESPGNVFAAEMRRQANEQLLPRKIFANCAPTSRAPPPTRRPTRALSRSRGGTAGARSREVWSAPQQ